VSGITIAIDGPAASGKSTTAAQVARTLGYSHLNSGLLYRAITWAALKDSWPDDDVGFAWRLQELDLDLDRIGSGSAKVSEVSARKAVRDRVLDLLRVEGGRGEVVCDGRDIGTVVFPDAELKVFLVASAMERGRRRLLDHGIEPTAEAVREEAERLEARDALDSDRAIAPLRKAEDAIALDTTEMNQLEVVERIVSLARERGALLS